MTQNHGVTNELHKQILCVISEWGYWGEELIGPLEALAAAGYAVDFATPTGKRPVALTPSMNPGYQDPALGRTVTSAEMASKVAALDAPGNSRLAHPINLCEWIPEYPYHSDSQYLRRTEQYYAELGKLDQAILKYDALLMVGGTGPIVDMVNNSRVHDLILSFYRAGKPIAAECFSVTCLAFARDLVERKSIISGKHVTGHCREYDYKSGTGFVGTDFVIGAPPYPQEYVLRDATAPNGAFHGNYGKPTSVIVDYPFITGRSTPDAYLTGQKLVEVLEAGLLRWGW